MRMVKPTPAGSPAVLGDALLLGVWWRLARLHLDIGVTICRNHVAFIGARAGMAACGFISSARYP